MQTQKIDKKASHWKRGCTKKKTKKAWDTQGQQWHGRLWLALVIESTGEEDWLQQQNVHQDQQKQENALSVWNRPLVEPQSQCALLSFNFLLPYFASNKRQILYLLWGGHECLRGIPLSWESIDEGSSNSNAIGWPQNVSFSTWCKQFVWEMVDWKEGAVQWISNVRSTWENCWGLQQEKC